MRAQLKQLRTAEQWLFARDYVDERMCANDLVHGFVLVPEGR